MNTLDKIKDLGFTLTSDYGYTLAIEDLYDEELEEFANSLEGDPNVDLARIQNDPDIMAKLKSMPFATFIESGARGSWDQAKTLVLTTGYKADSSNRIRPDLIRSSLVTGLTPDEFFNSCHGSRKGLLDTAVSTGDTGYLTRQLIYSNVMQEIGGEDCGTTDTISFNVTDYKTAKCLLWRWYEKEDGTFDMIRHDNFESFIGKDIKLRSPIYCKNKRICKNCYGGLHKILHSNQCGIVATQAIGERATQLVLRTFHISGVVQGGGADGDNADIISGMGMAKKLFHNPKAIKDFQSPGELVKLIYDIFGQYGTIQMVHYEVIVASMMWLKDKDVQWRLAENRSELEPDYVSILQVPSKASWLLGSAFANLKQKMLNGLVQKDMDEENAISRLFRY